MYETINERSAAAVIKGFTIFVSVYTGNCVIIE